MQFLEEQDFLDRLMESSRLGGWWHVSNLVRPGVWILSVLMQFIHSAMYLSDCPHVEMVW